MSRTQTAYLKKIAVLKFLRHHYVKTYESTYCFGLDSQVFFIILYNIIFKANFVVVKYEFIDNETAFLSKRYINVVFDR